MNRKFSGLQRKSQLLAQGVAGQIAIWLPALAAEEVFQQQESCMALRPAAAVLLVGTIAVMLLCTKVLSVACQLMAV